VYIGIVKFNESCISNDEEDDEEVADMGTLLERYIEGTRDALGIDFNVSGSSKNLCVGDSEGEGTDDLWSQHLEELGDKLNQDNDKTGFLRMVSRNHRFNCSSYSLSSLFSVGSATGSVKSTPTSRPGSTRSRRSSWQGPSCLRSLYQMLISPFEEELNVLDQTCFKELVLVLENDLLLVPFPILRSCTNEEYLCEKFKLILAPSISSIRTGGRCRSKTSTSIPLVIGNPSLPSAVTEQWGWEDIPRAQNEANMISEILQCQPLTGAKATKESVLHEMFNAECIHLATHISWKLSAIVLSPGRENPRNNTSSGEPSTSSSSKSDGNSSDGNSGDSTGDLPPFSDYLLTAADILKLRLNAKLVVLSSCHTRDKMGLANADSLTALTKALLAAGAMSVLVTLWPVPETASKIFFRALYSSLLQGSKVSHALTEAMLTVQHTKHFAHPANWAGYLLIGSDVQLSNKVTFTSQALWELMKSPERSRDALRVSLHLVCFQLLIMK
jgi:CHAT domain-containing protein